MNKYLEKIAEQAAKATEDNPIKHDWKPAIIGGAADIPAGAAIGAAGIWASKKFMKGKMPWLTTGLISGATTAGAADYLQRRSENKQRELLKKAFVGKHHDVPDRDFNEEELAKGRKVEREHTNDYQTAEDIAKDHLSELPDYYSRLKKMEHGVEKVANRVEKAIKKYHEHKDDIENISSTASQNYLSERKEKHKHKHKKHHKKKHRD